jgi:hypothetical protein
VTNWFSASTFKQGAQTLTLYRNLFGKFNDKLMTCLLSVIPNAAK